jgi:hypothetical protein
MKLQRIVTVPAVLSALFVGVPALAVEPAAEPPTAPDPSASAAETSSSTDPAAPEAVPAAPSPKPAESAPPVPVSPPAVDDASPAPLSEPPPALVVSKPVQPEDRPSTLFDSVGGKNISGFGGVNVLYTRFAHQDAVAVCGEGAVFVDHRLSLGGGGCGVATPVDGEAYGPAPHDPDDRLDFGYGGFIGRYHFFSRRVANLSVGTLIGAGGVVVSHWEQIGMDEDSEMRRAHAQGVFIVQPEVGGHLNVTRWLRFGAMVGYRVVAGVVMENLENDDVAGLVAGMQLHAGLF